MTTNPVFFKGFFKRFFTRAGDFSVAAGKEIFAHRDHAAVRDMTTTSIHQLKTARWRPDRTLPEPASFGELLERWGIEEEEIATVRRGMLIEYVTWLSLALIFVGLAIFAMLSGGSWVYPVAAVLILPPTVAMVATRCWRRSVLASRRYTPFLAWIGWEQEADHARGQ